MVKQAGGKRCDLQDTRRSSPSPRSRSRDTNYTAALPRGKVTGHVTIHHKMSTLGRKGAGGRQLRE